MNKLGEKSTNVFESSSKHTKLSNYHTNKTSCGDSQLIKAFKRENQQLAELYEFEETIGQGHYAVVKLARHLFTGEKVAIKIIDKLKLDAISREHLFQEVKCMKLVQHSHVVRLYEVIDTPSKLYLVLELGDGGDMYDYIMKHSNGLSEKKAKNYFGQIVAAIKYCHDLHVVHRDLKPENVVFFSQTGQVKLTDFGFSNIFIPGTKLLTSCGSLAYSAPEILLGDAYDAPAVDIWSLGVILYMLVTGRAPFQEANDSETLTMILDCKYYLPAHLSTDCAELISRMLVRDAEKRISLNEIISHSWFKEVNEEHQENGDEEFEDDDECPLEAHECDEDNKKVLTKPKATLKEKLLKNLSLIKRENLSDMQNEEIIECMVAGNIATKTDIIKALDEDQYNYITGTYYLFAERLLKKQFQRRNKRKLGPTAQLVKNKLLTSTEPSQPSVPVSYVPPNLNQYQAKRKYNSQTQRNKLVRQVEADEQECEENEPEAPNGLIPRSASLNDELLLKQEDVSSSHNLLPPVAGPLTNILEDEEELIESSLPKSSSQELNAFSTNQTMPSSRRSSRGTDNNTISALTILEEVETDTVSLASNGTPHVTKQLKPDETKEPEELGIDITQLGSELAFKPFVDKSELNIPIKKKFTPHNRISASSGAETSCSDNSDTEHKHHGMTNKPELLVIKDYDWNRSASSSDRSRNRLRNQNNVSQVKSLNEQPSINQRTRPLSISSETNGKEEFNSNQVGFNSDLLSNNKESASSSGCLNLMSPNYRQSFSTSNSNDYLASSLQGKTLSVEHRMANMSQMSINSQLSKNNSIRFPSRPGVCDTPNFQLGQQHSTTPTPRESIVFNRGDEKPIAKILSGQNSLQTKSFQNEASLLAGDQLDSQEADKILQTPSVTDTKPKQYETFSLNNHERPDEYSELLAGGNVENMLQLKMEQFNSTSSSCVSALRQNNESYSKAINGELKRSSHDFVNEPKSLESPNSLPDMPGPHSNSLKSNKSVETNGLLISQDEKLLKHSSLSHKQSRSMKTSFKSKPERESASTVSSKPFFSAKGCTKCCTII